jgi:hypothetical protein
MGTPHRLGPDDCVLDRLGDHGAGFGVVRRVRLDGQPLERVAADVEAGRIAPATAYQIAKVDDPAQQTEMAKEAAQGRLTRDVAQDREASRRQSRGGQPRNWTHTTGRVRVSLSPLADDVNDDELDEALRAAVAARRNQNEKRGKAA